MAPAHSRVAQSPEICWPSGYDLKDRCGRDGKLLTLVCHLYIQSVNTALSLLHRRTRDNKKTQPGFVFDEDGALCSPGHCLRDVLFEELL